MDHVVEVRCSGPTPLDQTPAMEIRELTTAERQAAIGLWEQAGLTRPWNRPDEDFDRAVGGPTSAVLGAIDDATLAATVMVGHDGHRGWVYYLAVEVSNRHCGLGRRMMREAESWLRARGAVKLHLMIRHTNAPARGFYHRLGYEDDEVTVVSRWLNAPGS
jgi:ribosomal protein S18 acetylase RimI-like enzyme